MIVRARFTAKVGMAQRTAEVVGELGEYKVFVGDEKSSLMASVLETSDVAEAMRCARQWMDSIEVRGEM